MDTVLLATQLVAVLAPVIPVLLKAGVEEIGKVAGGGVAKQLWDRLKPKIEQNPSVNTAVNAVASNPNSKTAQTLLIETLVPFLAVDPSLLKDLAALLAQEAGTQDITLSDSEAKNITQTSGQTPRQKITLTNSKAGDINQTQ